MTLWYVFYVCKFEKPVHIVIQIVLNHNCNMHWYSNQNMWLHAISLWGYGQYDSKEILKRVFHLFIECVSFYVYKFVSLWNVMWGLRESPGETQVNFGNRGIKTVKWLNFHCNNTILNNINLSQCCFQYTWNRNIRYPSYIRYLIFFHSTLRQWQEITLYVKI